MAVKKDPINKTEDVQWLVDLVVSKALATIDIKMKALKTKKIQPAIFRDEFEKKIVIIRNPRDIVAIKGGLSDDSCTVFLKSGSAVSVAGSPKEVWRKIHGRMEVSRKKVKFWPSLLPDDDHDGGF